MRNMKRPEYLRNYMFDWDLLDVVLGGKSSIDSKYFIDSIVNEEEVNDFLIGYGFNPDDLVQKAELYGNFQEAMDFIKRYFLKGDDDFGLDLEIPSALYMITDISELFLLAGGKGKSSDVELRLWADVILKVMHTILHVDKDLRSEYFSTIQTQIFDRFYKYIYREDDKLFLGIDGDSNKIQLEEFETKAKKSRESVIIKLLHKVENVAEELFDRIGVRILTQKKSDSLRVVKFLLEQNIIIPHNIKPSRSLNSLINLKDFKKRHQNLVRLSIRNDLTETEFLQVVERECNQESIEEESTGVEHNKHSLDKYRAIQFTCRQLIRYKNPFLQEFNKIKAKAKNEDKDAILVKDIMHMDTSLIARDVRFFYPFEIQILDKETHDTNTMGAASHSEYKKAQRKSAMLRVFKALIEYKQLEV